MTQNARILLLLYHQGEEGVTPDLARTEVGCWRLASRIGELRSYGHDIVNVNRHGKFARYVLRPPAEMKLWAS